MGPTNSAPAKPSEKRLLDVVRDAIRTRHYSIRTEEAYVNWVRRLILFHGKRHPKEIGGREVEAFLTHLAVEGHVSASTQNQALSALLFLLSHGAPPGARLLHRQPSGPSHPNTPTPWTDTPRGARDGKRYPSEQLSKTRVWRTRRHHLDEAACKRPFGRGPSPASTSGHLPHVPPQLRHALVGESLDPHRAGFLGTRTSILRSYTHVLQRGGLAVRSPPD